MPSPSPTTATEEPALFTRGFALVLAMQLAFGFAYSSFLLLPKYVVTELHAGPSQVGLLGALPMIAAVLASPLCGRLLQDGPRRPQILLGTLSGALASLAFMWVSELGGLLYAARIVQGFSFTLFYVAAVTLIADIAPASRLGQAIGWFGAGSLLMNAIATLIAERVARDYGWHTVFGCALAAGCVALVLALCVREPERAHSPLGEPATKATKAAGTPGRASVYWAALSGGAAFGALFTFTQPFALSLGDTELSPLFAAYTGMALFVRIAFGNLADRLGRARVAVSALAFYVLVVVGAAALEHGYLTALGLAFGLAHGMFYPAVNALALEGAKREERGGISAYFNASFTAGVVLVTFCLGHVAERYGYRVVFLIAAVLTASGLPLLLSQLRRKYWLARPLSE